MDFMDPYLSDLFLNSLPSNPDFRWNIVRKGENAGNQQFLISQIFFYTSKREFLFLSYIYLVVCKCFQYGPV